MTLKLTAEKLDDIEEVHRPLYIEKDGKFHLDVDGIEDTAGLKKSLAQLRKQQSELDKKIKAWESVGKTPEEIAELSAKWEEQQVREAENKGEWDKLRSQMNERHEVALKKIQDEVVKRDRQIEGLNQRLESQLVESAAIAAITAERGAPELLLHPIKRFIKVVNENEHRSLQVVDDKGEARVNGKGEPLTLSELVQEMRNSDVFGRAFEGTNAAGGGMRPGAGAGGPPGNITKRSDFGPVGSIEAERKRAAYIDKYGISAYNNLPLN